jgi:hypothetical protein
MSVFTGVYELLNSPSGIFSLLTLVAISAVTWHSPSVGGVAFSAFVAVIPSVLALVEHREAMLSMQQSNTQTTIVVDSPKGQ